MKLYNLSDLEGCIAILGGSFDPIHAGHIHIAKQVLYWSRISSVVFVPNGKHHFKSDSVQLSYKQRYGLIKKAIEGEKGLAISTADEDGSGYTADFMQLLMEENPHTHYVFIIGSDNVAGLANWYNFTWLAANLHFLILPRPGYPIDMEIVKSIRATLLPIELSPISSTGIKQRISNGEDISSMVPPSVHKDIIRLYSKERKAKDSK